MKLDEAIKILTKWKEEGEGDGNELDNAENLAIEALKRIQKSHTLTPYEWQLPLPGETK